MNILDTYWLGFIFGALTTAVVVAGVALLIGKALSNATPETKCVTGKDHDFGPWLVAKEMDDRQSRHVIIQHKTCRNSKCRFTEARTQTTRF